ncbi:MAG: sulfurtransferase [Gemmatimonadaceae bacterium]
MRILAPLVALAAVTAVTGCVHASPSAPPPVRSELLLSVAEAAPLVARPGVVVLQVERDSATFARGHIAGARFLPLSAIVIERDGIPNELPPPARLDSTFRRVGITGRERVILVGEPLWATRGFFTLDYLGHPSVALLDGGMTAWRRAGHPVEQGGARPLPTESIPRAPSLLAPDTGRIVDAIYVLNHIRHPRVTLVDARPDAEFTGKTPGDAVVRGGHIPGAAHLFWRTLMQSDTVPLMNDTTALRAIFAGAGVEPGDSVVTYCRTGIMASYAYFAARYMGYPVRMYDGSFVEWSRNPAYPVERPKAQ